MANENTDRMIARVKALLALADSEKNTNEAEAKSARAQADRLIQEHRITQAQLESAGGKKEDWKSGIVWSGGRRIAWVELVLSALCHHYGGDFFFYSQRKGGVGGRGGGEGGKGTANYTLLALESDFAIIEYMLTYLIRQVERLGRWHCGGEGVKFAAAWRMGCAKGIASQFEELRRELARELESDAAKSTALVFLGSRHDAAKAEMVRQHPNMRVGRHITGGTDLTAQMAGYAEGRKIEVRTALNEGQKASALTA